MELEKFINVSFVIIIIALGSIAASLYKIAEIRMDIIQTDLVFIKADSKSVKNDVIAIGIEAGYMVANYREMQRKVDLIDKHIDSCRQ